VSEVTKEMLEQNIEQQQRQHRALQANLIETQANINATEGAIQAFQYLLSQIENGVGNGSAPCDKDETNETQ
jgi:septal ring factor EnvC (AmiA/AmiB activator)